MSDAMRKLAGIAKAVEQHVGEPVVEVQIRGAVCAGCNGDRYRRSRAVALAWECIRCGLLLEVPGT